MCARGYQWTAHRYNGNLMFTQAKQDGAPGKTIVVADGRIKAVVIPNVKSDTLRGVVLGNVEPGATVSTDELYSYGSMTSDGFKHGRA